MLGLLLAAGLLAASSSDDLPGHLLPGERIDDIAGSILESQRIKFVGCFLHDLEDF